MKSNKILIIQTAFLGDAILTLPLIQKVLEQYPGAVIDVLCIPSTKGIFESSPFVSAVICYDKRSEHKSVYHLVKLAGKLKQNNYSKIISPHRSFRTAFLVLLTGVKDSTGFTNASMSFVYNKRVKYNIKDHEVKRNLSLIKEGARDNDWKILPQVKIPFEADQKVDDFIKRNQFERIIAVAPGSVWATKVYPKEYFKQIISWLNKNSFSVVVLGGREDEQLSCALSDSFNSRVISAAGKFSIIESIALLKRCMLLVSNDSAPTHMAMCAGIPALTIYCSTVPGFGFFPYSEKSAWLSYEELECKPCGIHGFKKCPVDSFDCAYKLSPEKVINQIMHMV